MGSLRFDPPRLEFPDESRLRVESRIEPRNPMRLRHLWRGPVVQVLDAKGCFFPAKELTCVAHTEKVNIYCDGCYEFLSVVSWRTDCCQLDMDGIDGWQSMAIQ